ncbi:MAG: hypothetical protein ACLP5H_16865 [Desulfomonilaceae bacterium]
MTKNERINKMHTQILNLRSATIVCGTVVHYFPACAKPEGSKLGCPEGRAALQQLYEDMYEVLVFARMALAAVFHPNPEGWDFLWSLTEYTRCVQKGIAKLWQAIYCDLEEFTKCCGEMDSDMMEALGTDFSEEEWGVLTAKGAWQNARRLPQVLHLLTYLEDQIAKQFDSLDAVIYSGVLGDCELGNWTEQKKGATA